jgi:hypothetical protein
METNRTQESLDPVLGFPEDPEVERQRLIDDAAARGIEPEEALQVVEELSTAGEPRPQDYRAVDRRLASGYDVDDTRRILVDHDMTPTSERGRHGDDGPADDAVVEERHADGLGGTGTAGLV